MSDAIDGRLKALDRAAGLADGRLEPEDVEAARAVVARAGARLGLGVDTTVIALAGPTGAGKSSLFNALAGAELTPAGVRRPTTAAVSAAVWGAVNPALLDWLQVARRHVRPESAPEGRVLLDLPDYDSVEDANRVEVERVIELADLLVWVVDPQKYADAALHDRYLRRLAGHRDSMLVVLNQADRLDPAGVDAWRADMRRLLTADGLDGLPVLAVSAREGQGLPELRAVLEERTAARASAVARLGADVDAAAARLAAACEHADDTGSVARQDVARLVAALADAAGVPAVTSAVARAHRRRGSLAAGWPIVRWLGRLRPDPLKRLRLTGATAGAQDAIAHTSLAPATPAQRAQASAATRALAAQASGGLPPPWPNLVRSAATAREDELGDRLDRAVGGADLERRRPRWWAVVGVAQKLLALTALIGALWLLVIAGLGFAQLDDAVPLPDLEGLPVPTLMLVGGLLAGFALALLARWLTGVGAARRARAAERALLARVSEVGRELVVAPVEAELAAREQLCAALTDARAPRGGRRLGRHSRP